ncbi:hypothetical protein [Paenibacillus macquariensis]|nr:hypothetical protein [Paenibacillus macquariensis]MEC0092151.1 hypothetical protein [Paenibacillus macquariensis]
MGVTSIVTSAARPNAWGYSPRHFNRPPPEGSSQEPVQVLANKAV